MLYGMAWDFYSDNPASRPTLIFLFWTSHTIVHIEFIEVKTTTKNNERNLM